jgi:hypothetical protein
MLYYLSERGPEVPLRDIVTYLVRYEGGHREEYPVEAYRRVHAAVLQSHLGALKNHDVVSETGSNRNLSLQIVPPVLTELMNRFVDDSVLPEREPQPELRSEQ